MSEDTHRFKVDGKTFRRMVEFRDGKTKGDVVKPGEDLGEPDHEPAPDAERIIRGEK